MKNKMKIYLLLIAFGISFASCLDKYPEDAIQADKAINTVDDANQAIIGIYAAFKDASLYSGCLTLLPDLQSDLAYAVTGYSNQYGDIWRWNILATNSDIESVYGGLYAVINRCNFLLDYIPHIQQAVTDDDALDKLDMIHGEALFARALCYSELIKLFCKSYEGNTEAENELGVALTSKYNTTDNIRRASLRASYQFVLSDLDLAAAYLKIDEDNVTKNDLYNTAYFNEYTVYALRARIALYMKDYEEAIKYSSKVIESGYYVLSSANTQYGSTGQSYYQYMWTNDSATEIILKVGFTSTSYGAALGTIFFNYDYSTVRPDYVPAKWALDLYESSDLRYSIFFQTYLTGYPHALQWPLLQKYWGNTTFLESYNIRHTSMPKVFRLSEQYLIRAEAYCQKENPDYGSAGKDITALRMARYAIYGSGTTLSKNNAMDVIEKERVKELYMEGFRLQDLKRWHKGFERKPQSESLTNGSSLKVEKDDPLFVWPIPQNELDAPGADIQPNESNK